MPTEKSEGGSLIYRHQAQGNKSDVAMTDTQAVEAIERHIDKYVGPDGGVFHEIVSEYVHIDVHIVPPSAQHNFYTLITTGMSDVPMSIPQGAEPLRYAELMLCLPGNWKMTQQDWKEEANYWPIRWLKTLARLPHQYQTWLGHSHTVPNGDPPKPFASNTGLSGVILSLPVLFGDSFTPISVRPDKLIHIYSVIPLYTDELDFKLKRGVEALFDRLAQAKVTELLDIGRQNTCGGSVFSKLRRNVGK